MELPDFLEKELASLVELPLPWSVRLLRRLAPLAAAEAATVWQAAWQHASPLKRGGLIAHLQEICELPEKCQAILGRQSPPAIFYDWQKEVGGQLEAVTGKPLLPIKVTTTLYEFSKESTRLSLQPEGGQPAEWERLVREIRKKADPIFQLRKNSHYDEVLAATLISLGMARVKAQAKAKAQEAFLEAIQMADKLGNLELLVNACNQLATLYLFGFGAINQGLKTILPLWEKYLEGQPSLDLAQLADTLANIYAFARDPLETKHFIAETASQLSRSGFPYSPGQKLLEALPVWTRRATGREARGALHYNDFLRALAMWGSNVSLRRNTAESPGAFATLAVQGTELQQGYFVVLEVFNEQVRVDGALMRELEDYLEGDPARMFPEVSAEVQAEGLRIDERLESKTVDQALVSAIKQLLRESTFPFARMQNLWRLGAALQALGDTPAADESFAEAQQLAEAYRGLDDLLHTLLLRTQLIPVSEGQRILALCLEGVNKTEAARQNVITPYQQVTFFQGRTELYQMALAWSREVGDWDTFFGIGDLLKARNFSFPEVPEESLRDLRTQLSKDYSAIANELKPEARLSLLRKRQLRYDNWLLMHLDAWRGWDLQLPREDLWAGLERGEGLLTYYKIRPEVWIVVLLTGDKDHVSAVLKPPPNWLKERLAEVANIGSANPGYRARGMEPYTGEVRPANFLRRRTAQEVLQDLADFLLPPQIVAAMDACDRLFVCPHKELHLVPFHALPWREEAYLLEAFALSYLPNLHSLLYKDAAFTCQRSVALIGTGTFGDRDGAILSTLAGARTEVLELQRYYTSLGLPVSSFIEVGATRSALEQAVRAGKLREQDIIHLALHGENVPADSPLDTRLFLSDGSIDGFDITNWNLTAELVILSACYAGVRSVSGRGLESLPGDDVFGLQAAFFAAGARRVLGAMWPVDDQAGLDLMLAFHRHLTKYSPARAWQHTVIDYLRTAPENRKGLEYWAPFFLVEEGRKPA